MWSRKPLVVVLALLIVVLVILTNKINTNKRGGHHHHHQEEPQQQQKQPAKSEEEKPEFPAYKHLDVETITTPSGLQYQDIRIGRGRAPKVGDIVSVRYTGWKPGGRPFDSNDAPELKPFEFPFGRHKVIKGWDEGVKTMRVGGKRRLIIPPELAYGEVGYLPRIEPNMTLIFDVQLLAITGKGK